MRPPLAAITRCNQGWNLLQTFLTMRFLIDRHARFTEALSSSALLWHVLQAFSSMYVYHLKLRGFKSDNCGDQKSLQKPMLAFIQSCTVLLRVAAPCPVGKE